MMIDVWFARVKVGRGGMVEELGDVVVGEWIGVRGAVRVQLGELGGQRCRAVRALVGHWIRADRLQDLVAGGPVGRAGRRNTVPSPEPDAAVVAAGLIGSIVGPDDHVDDRFQIRAREDREGPIGRILPLGRQLVGRSSGADHRAPVPPDRH